jgi:RNA polymerase sigma-70 factor (ECF subfamily)
VPDAPDSFAADLTRRLAAGQAAAVEEFYRRYFDFLYAEARRVTRRDESFCLDVVQETVLKVIRVIRPVENEAQMAAWLRVVVRTVAYDLLRSERRREARQAAAVATGGMGGMGANEQAAVEPDELDRLRDEIARLDPELARMIELRYEQRWTLRRIGAALGLTTGAIDGRLRRALRTLRGRMERSEHD